MTERICTGCLLETEEGCGRCGRGPVLAPEHPYDSDDHAEARAFGEEYGGEGGE